MGASFPEGRAKSAAADRLDMGNATQSGRFGKASRAEGHAVDKDADRLAGIPRPAGLAKYNDYHAAV